MLDSRLLVYTYKSTGFLEAFVSIIPCIIFWDPGVSRLRPAAAPYFNDLKAVGVLHESPQDAAAHVQCCRVVGLATGAGRIAATATIRMLRT
jgi:putative transferase (TIGR04331 family)